MVCDFRSIYYNALHDGDNNLSGEGIIARRISVKSKFSHYSDFCHLPRVERAFFLLL